jgi:phage baseplate assembly protein W
MFVPPEMTSRSYHFDLDSQRVRGITDRREAMRQAIYLIIYTERYQYPIYSRNYGAEMNDLIGQPIPFVLPEIRRRVTEALMHDDRITAVDNWNFNVQRGKVAATFTAHTIYGDIGADVEVNI